MSCAAPPAVPPASISTEAVSLASISTIDDIVALIVARDDYKDRAARDAESVPE